MGKEIERKYLVDLKKLPKEVLNSPSKKTIQGFLNPDKNRTVRVRVQDDKGWLTVKGKGDIIREEFEYEIPKEDAVELLKLCSGHLIEKTRYLYEGYEIDFFEGSNAGLIVAEEEVDSEEEFHFPSWGIKDVSTDSRYKNSSLSVIPFSQWPQNIPKLEPAQIIKTVLVTDPTDPRLGRGPDTKSVPQNEAYLILSEEERAKGFIRKVRQSYVHKTCGTRTTMSLPLAETYARNPKFYSGTYCVGCSMHRPVSEFLWDGTNEEVGS